MPDETVTFLTKAKKLITHKKRSVAARADFIQNLALIGILNIDEIWHHILSLTKFQRLVDYKPAYDGGQEAYIFIKNIHGEDIYIKLKIEIQNNEEILVCLSFHK
ncbi:hypothetical protein [Paracholeplasma manati]|uniref:Type II toxin-antitoxin system MqsR family toxin n=1 Tax=Paracholeplasma manati TaxID=591373 RepID=A0ABT2Y4A4_9MOLU|nr:hypothetical protein [Paracholeplasma manati]MCV2231563.1 hypothetical protein [Paracholeplasma manati]MDG0889391.1 hypothetical protein [Paracholeplasma manati]